MKVYAIGDIHGCFKTFFTLLEKLNYSKEDKLILLGDLIDRGGSSKEVLDLVIDLKNSGFDIGSVMGNHDIMMLESLRSKEGYENWKFYGGDSALRSFGVEHIRDIPDKYFELISDFKAYIVYENYLLVHGGLNFDLEDPLEDTESMMWERNRDGIDKDKLDGKTMLVGHTPKPQSTIEESLEKRRIFLDGGCCYADNPDLGKLFVLELTKKKLYWQTNIE